MSQAPFGRGRVQVVAINIRFLGISTGHGPNHQARRIRGCTLPGLLNNGRASPHGIHHQARSNGFLVLQSQEDTIIINLHGLKAGPFDDGSPCLFEAPPCGFHQLLGRDPRIQSSGTEFHTMMGGLEAHAGFGPGGLHRSIQFRLAHDAMSHQGPQFLPAHIPLLISALNHPSLHDAHCEALVLKGSCHQNPQGPTTNHHIEELRIHGHFATTTIQSLHHLRGRVQSFSTIVLQSSCSKSLPNCLCPSNAFQRDISSFARSTGSTCLDCLEKRLELG
mmetsp:Transcript_53772/g.117629  ORF Transcript_53772/g.117629 Transcript_53772/m.117629 type:complete len:277 (-) Transcript_53772:377-1207(-)